MRRHHPLLRLVIFALVLCGGCFAIFSGCQMRSVQSDLDDHGVVVEGSVVDATTRSRRGRRKYYLGVQYQTDAATLSANLRVSEQIYDAHARAAQDAQARRIAVRYLPEDVSEVRVVGYDEDWRVPIGVGAALVLLGVIGGLLTLRKLASG